jgi:hypothetical protein
MGTTIPTAVTTIIAAATASTGRRTNTSTRPPGVPRLPLRVPIIRFNRPRPVIKVRRVAVAEASNVPTAQSLARTVLVAHIAWLRVRIHSRHSYTITAGFPRRVRRLSQMVNHAPHIHIPAMRVLRTRRRFVSRSRPLRTGYIARIQVRVRRLFRAVRRIRLRQPTNDVTSTDAP